jgi:hypothetical protein
VHEWRNWREEKGRGSEGGGRGQPETEESWNPDLIFRMKDSPSRSFYMADPSFSAIT